MFVISLHVVSYNWIWLAQIRVVVVSSSVRCPTTHHHCLLCPGTQILFCRVVAPSGRRAIRGKLDFGMPKVLNSKNASKWRVKFLQAEMLSESSTMGIFPGKSPPCVCVLGHRDDEFKFMWGSIALRAPSSLLASQIVAFALVAACIFNGTIDWHPLILMGMVEVSDDSSSSCSGVFYVWISSQKQWTIFGSQFTGA